MSPTGIPNSALSMSDVARLVLDILEEDDVLNLDDALWCYAYEPRCQQLRTLLNQKIGVHDKAGMIDWCDTHTQAEAIELVKLAT